MIYRVFISPIKRYKIQESAEITMEGPYSSFEEKSRITSVLYVWVVAWTFPTYVEGTFCTGVYYVSPKMRNLPVLKMALPFPVLVPISSNVLLGGPFLKNFHILQSPNWQSAITGTERDSFCPISGTGLCQFRYGCSSGPVPELDSMRMVPFPVPGSASSGTVVHRAPYRNWTLRS